MSLGTIRAVLCGGVLIIGSIIGIVGGVPGWALAVVLVTGVPSLFAYGCHTAARQAYDQGADDAFSAVEYHLDP